MTPEAACRAIHAALERIPARTRPTDVPFRDGLYFFYERGEKSEHGCDRIVRVGNHPRSDGRLVRRLRDHYSGNKNGSVFRRYFGGALLRRENPTSPCLAPTPGRGHWESQNGEPCGACSPYEQAVLEALARDFWFRCVQVGERDLRNVLERRLIVSLAACPACRPSPGWLGAHAYPESVRSSGMWNVEGVGDTPLAAEELQSFLGLAGEGEDRDDRRVPKRSEEATLPALPDSGLTLLVIPCSMGKEKVGPREGAGPSILDSLSEDLVEELALARENNRARAAVNERSLLPAWRRYARGLVYRAAAPLLEEWISRGGHVLILSGGYGVVTGSEPIGDYDAQLHPHEWPGGLLARCLVEYATEHDLSEVAGFAGRSTSYADVLRDAPWRGSRVSRVILFSPRNPPGGDPRGIRREPSAERFMPSCRMSLSRVG